MPLVRFIRDNYTVPNPPTIADGARTTSMGDFTFPLVRQYVDEIVTVSEDSIKRSVAFAFNHLKLVLEPSGALTIAALLYDIEIINIDNKRDVGLKTFHPKGRIGAILSGGNIDPQLMIDILRFRA